MKTYAIVAYSGGAAKELAQKAIHFDVDDMQIAEDLQLICGHMCMQWLNTNPDSNQEIMVEIDFMSSLHKSTNETTSQELMTGVSKSKSS